MLHTSFKSYRSLFPHEFSLSCSPHSCLSNLVHHFGFIYIPWALLKSLIPWIFASCIGTEDHLFKKLACLFEFFKNVKWSLRGLRGENCLAIQWLGHGAVTAVGPGLISGPGTSIPQVNPHSQKKKKKKIEKLNGKLVIRKYLKS